MNHRPTCTCTEKRKRARAAKWDILIALPGMLDRHWRPRPEFDPHYPCEQSDHSADLRVALNQDDISFSNDAVEIVHVVYHGLSDRFRRISAVEELEVTVRKYDLHRPFMFYPAGTWLHKNHLRLLKVIRRLVDSGSFDGELLLTGAAMEAHEQVLEEISRLQLEGVVRWLGYLPEEDLPRLYNLARMLVFPSMFEGFGLPVLEAMACGCPVACSDVTSLPEVGGDAVVYFNPDVEDDFYETLKKLWNNEELCSELRQKGEQRSKMFSWEETAKQTVEVYRSVYEVAQKF